MTGAARGFGARVARLEAAKPPGCTACVGAVIGVEFMEKAPGDHDPYPDGSRGPLPPQCPACGRRLPKLYLLPNRASWDGMVRR